MDDHPARLWLHEIAGHGLVRMERDGWTAFPPASALELHQTVTATIRKGARLPNGNAVTPASVTSFLRQMSARLPKDPRTKGLDLRVGGDATQLEFRALPAHEDLPEALRQLLPDLFDGNAAGRVGIVLIPAAGVSLDETASTWNRFVLDVLQGETEWIGASLLEGPLRIEVREGRWRIDAGSRPGRCLRALSLPLYPYGGGGGLGDRSRFHLGASPGVGSIPTGRRVLVTGILHVRREALGSVDVRRRLISERGDLRGIPLDVLALSEDAWAVEEGVRLARRWGERGGDVRWISATPEEYADRIQRGDYDILVKTFSDELFEEPRIYWHSRGSRNRSGHTTAEIDDLTEELDATVTPQGRSRVVRTLRSCLERDGVLLLLREGELHVSSPQEFLDTLRSILTP